MRVCATITMTRAYKFMLPRAFDITYAAMIPSRIGTGPLRDEAESSAMSALDDYQDQAFDYRCDDAGRWDDKPASAERHAALRRDAVGQHVPVRRQPG